MGPAGCKGHRSSNRSQRCRLTHLPYPSAFIRHLHTSPLPYSDVPYHTDRFESRLCLEPTPGLSTPASPVYVVALPVPAVSFWQGLVIGKRGSHHSAMARLASLDSVALTATPVLRNGDGPRWVNLKGRGAASGVDGLIECWMFLVERAKTPPHPGDDLVQELQLHMAAYQQRRAAAPHSLFFSLDSRGLTVPGHIPTMAEKPSASASATDERPNSAPTSSDAARRSRGRLSVFQQPTASLASSEEEGSPGGREPCRLYWTKQGCSQEERRCPLVHLSYRGAIARYLDRTPCFWPAVWDRSPTFHPLLCADPAAALQFILVLPIPPMRSFVGSIMGHRTGLFSTIRRVCQMPRASSLWFNAENKADEGYQSETEYLSLKARGIAWQLDTLIDAVCFLVSHPEGYHWDAQEGVRQLEEHIADFIHRRGGKLSTEFLSLQPSSPSASPSLRSPSTTRRSSSPRRPASSPSSRSSSPLPRRPPSPSTRRSPSPSRPQSPSTVSHAVCMTQWMFRSGCSDQRCQEQHGSYVELFTSLLDRRFLPFPRLPSTTPDFRPVLARCPDSGLWTVSMPLPRFPHLLSLMIGPGGATLRSLLRLSGLRRIGTEFKDCVAHVPGQPSVEWRSLRAEGEKGQVDVIMQAALWFVEGGASDCHNSEERGTSLERHLDDFKRRAEAAKLGADEFFSLISRQLPPQKHGRTSNVASPQADSKQPVEESSQWWESREDTLPDGAPSLASPQSSSTSSFPFSTDSAAASAGSAFAAPSLLPCMANLDPGRCPQSTACPYSHLPYVDLFASLCHSRPILVADIPELSPAFYPVLARIPASPSRYVVSFPLPRLPFIISPLVGLGRHVLASLCELSGVTRLQWPTSIQAQCSRYREGEPPVEWLQLTAEGEKDDVDALIEAVLFILEQGVHLKSQFDLRSRLRDQIAAFRLSLQQRPEGGGADDFLSLQSRGAPPLPSDSPSLSSPTIADSVFKMEDPEPVHVPESAVLDLSAWYKTGESVTVSSALLVPDHSSSPSSYLRCLPDKTFACLPIEWDPKLRDVFSYDVVDGQPQLSQIESTWQVDVFVPRTESIDEQEKGTQEQGAVEGRWLNVTVWKDGSSGGGEKVAVEEAVRCLVQRYEAVLRQLRGAATAAATIAQLSGTPSATKGKRSIAQVEADYSTSNGFDIGAAETAKRTRIG